LEGAGNACSFILYSSHVIPIRNINGIIKYTRAGIRYRITTDRFLLPTGHAFYFNTIEDISDWKSKSKN